MPTFDQYGGRTDITCPGGASSNFTLQKVGNRWWLCTPLGNAYFYQGIGAWTEQVTSGFVTPISFTTKYGTSNHCTIANYQILEAQSWNFNAVGQLYGNSNLLADGVCSSTITKVPYTQSNQVSLYSTAGPFSLGNNFVNYAPRPTKNMVTGNDDFSLCSGSNSSTCRNTGGVANFRGAGLVDVFDPVYTTFANQLFINDPFFVAHRGTPYLLGVFVDDTDFLAGMGCTGDFETSPAGHNKPHMGYIVLTTSPVLTYSTNTYNTTRVYYTDANVYSKNHMASPPTTCNKATPCSFGSYLLRLYSGNPANLTTNIGNLNSAWGTGGFYTTFGSTGQCVGYTSASFCGSGSGSASETLQVGNGTTSLIPNKVLANGPVSQFSVQLLLNGTVFAGDCPGISANPSCQVTSITNGGTFPPVISPGPWTSGVTKVVGNQILDSNGYLQTVTIAGKTGISAPSWSMAFGGTTTDGTSPQITWRNDGPILVTGPTPFLQNEVCTGSGSGFGAASFWAQIFYHGTPPAGISNQISSRQIGATCGAAGNRVRVTGPDGATGSQTNPSWATGYDVYMSCRNSSGGAANGCAASGPNTAPPLTLQATNIPIGQIASISCTSNVVTVTTVSAHGMSIGDKVDLFRTSGGFDADFNSNNIIASTPDSFTLTYSVSSCPSASGSGGTIWKEFFLPNAPMLSGAALPTPPGTIDYTNKTVNLGFTANLQTGTTVSINYVANGFGLGTGLMDEDGRNTNWVGFESVCLKPVAGGGAGTTSYACRSGNGGGYALPTMHTQVATDVSNWQTQFTSQYSTIIKAAMKQPSAVPNLLYFGPDTIGDWYGPPRSEVLAGFGGNADGIFVTYNADIPDTTTAATVRSYLEMAYGDHPIMIFSTLEANPDSSLSGASPGVTGLSTQALRGAAWYHTNNTVLNTVGANRTFQFVGNVWWGSHDNSVNECTNWGLKTASDNAYNGVEPAVGSVPCSGVLSAFTCGSEPPTTGSNFNTLGTCNGTGLAVRPYGNSLLPGIGVQSGNALWFNVPAIPSTVTAAPAKWIWV